MNTTPEAPAANQGTFPKFSNNIAARAEKRIDRRDGRTEFGKPNMMSALTYARKELSNNNTFYDAEHNGSTIITPQDALTLFTTWQQADDKTDYIHIIKQLPKKHVLHTKIFHTLEAHKEKADLFNRAYKLIPLVQSLLDLYSDEQETPMVSLKDQSATTCIAECLFDCKYQSFTSREVHSDAQAYANAQAFIQAFSTPNLTWQRSTSTFRLSTNIAKLERAFSAMELPVSIEKSADFNFTRCITPAGEHIVKSLKQYISSHKALKKVCTLLSNQNLYASGKREEDVQLDTLELIAYAAHENIAAKALEVAAPKSPFTEPRKRAVMVISTGVVVSLMGVLAVLRSQLNGSATATNVAVADNTQTTPPVPPTVESTLAPDPRPNVQPEPTVVESKEKTILTDPDVDDAENLFGPSKTSLNENSDTAEARTPGPDAADLFNHISDSAPDPTNESPESFDDIFGQTSRIAPPKNKDKAEDWLHSAQQSSEELELSAPENTLQTAHTEDSEQNDESNATDTEPAALQNQAIEVQNPVENTQATDNTASVEIPTSPLQPEPIAPLDIEALSRVQVVQIPVAVKRYSPVSFKNTVNTHQQSLHDDSSEETTLNTESELTEVPDSLVQEPTHPVDTSAQTDTSKEPIDSQVTPIEKQTSTPKKNPSEMSIEEMLKYLRSKRR